MIHPHVKKSWHDVCSENITALAPLLKDLGFVLDPHQKHIIGERYIMRAVTTESGCKLVLTGKRTSDHLPVIIKAASDAAGVRELERERERRTTLNHMRFAYGTFFSPKELLFARTRGFTIVIYEFIEQEKPFIERPLQEQFTFALTAFKAQESAHATTYEHLREIAGSFDHKNARDYLATFHTFIDNIKNALSADENHAELLARAKLFLQSHIQTIEQYGGFLTHTDFVPHNIRIRDGHIYLLDHSSIRFGNKYEGWARFLNFMELYNPPLTQALTEYVRENRTPEELLALKLMRVYRLGEILWYYVQTLPKSAGDLHALNKARIALWADILTAVLDDTILSSSRLEEYKKIRDRLRSDEEKQRQIGLH